MGAALVIGVDGDPIRLAMSRRMGADVVLDFTKVDVVDEVTRLTDGYGADVAIEALGHAADLRERAADASSGRDAVEPRRLLRQARAAVRRLRGRSRRSPHRHDPLPGRQGADGRLIAMVQSGRFDPTPLITHHFALERHRARRTGSSATGSTAC